MTNALKLGTKLSDYDLIDWGYGEMLSDLENGKPFAYTRWGDGEWNCIFGRQGRNCDGHTYFPLLGEKLKSIILSNPRYYKGLQTNPCLTSAGSKIYNMLQGRGIKWVNSNILHHASIKGKFNQYFEVVKKRKNILVANKWLKEFNKFGFSHVQIPEINCFADYKNIFDHTKMACDVIGKGSVVHIAASLMTGVLIDDLYKRFEDDFTFVDVGSALDPYVKGDNGKRRNIRSYHKKLIIQ